MDRRGFLTALLAPALLPFAPTIRISRLAVENSSSLSALLAPGLRKVYYDHLTQHYEFKPFALGFRVLKEAVPDALYGA